MGGGFGMSNKVGMAFGFNFLQPSLRWLSNCESSKCFSHKREESVGLQLVPRRIFCTHLSRRLSLGNLKSRMPFSDLLLQLKAVQHGILIPLHFKKFT